MTPICSRGTLLNTVLHQNSTDWCSLSPCSRTGGYLQNWISFSRKGSYTKQKEKKRGLAEVSMREPAWRRNSEGVAKHSENQCCCSTVNATSGEQGITISKALPERSRYRHPDQYWYLATVIQTWVTRADRKFSAVWLRDNHFVSEGKHSPLYRGIEWKSWLTSLTTTQDIVVRSGDQKRQGAELFLRRSNTEPGGAFPTQGIENYVKYNSPYLEICIAQHQRQQDQRQKVETSRKIMGVAMSSPNPCMLTHIQGGNNKQIF